MTRAPHERKTMTYTARRAAEDNDVLANGNDHTPHLTPRTPRDHQKMTAPPQRRAQSRLRSHPAERSGVRIS